VGEDMKCPEVLDILLDSVHNGIIAINKDGIITICNRAARIMMRIEENIEGQPIETIISNTQLLNVLNTGQAQYAVKFTYGDKTFLTNRSPIILNKKVVGAVAVFQEITDLEHISSELAIVQNLNRELNAIIESIDDGILILDEKGKILRVNKSLERVTGLSIQEYNNNYLHSLYEKGLLLYKPIASSALERKEIITNFQAINTGKELIITARPVTDDEGNITRVVSTVRDITELTKLRRELEQSQKLTDLYLAQLNQLSKERFLKGNKIITRNTEMLNLLDMSYRIAQTETTVLILGESGVGKELIAENIHNWSNRAEKGSMIEVNCSAIPKELLESELFGYEPGSFTGAKKKGKPGLFELANEGTIFLDEIGDLPLEMQAKLLRVLEVKEFFRIGGVKPIKVNTRFIAATNQNLEQSVKEGMFREDLYYRLNIVPIVIPPLRKRKEDIPVLLSFFLSKYNKKYQSSKSFSPKAVTLLQKYSWPGNVRELKNIVERLVLISNQEIIQEEDLPEHILNIVEKVENKTYSLNGKSLKEAKEELEIVILKKEIEKHRSIRQVAQALGLSHTAVLKKVHKYNLL
jgi:PAS domain S-box-containing protein/TyrR family helix-turn-helix protein